MIIGFALGAWVYSRHGREGALWAIIVIFALEAINGFLLLTTGREIVEWILI